MASPQINGVLFLGSVPVRTAEDCFRTICAALPGRIKYIPDGEPGERENFIRWQVERLGREPRTINTVFNPTNPTTYSDEEADDILQSLKDFETEFDDFALQSYATFKNLKDEGVLPQDVRFQVCLPTPINVILSIHSDLRSKVEVIYEAALLRALRSILEKVPHAELAVQFDCPLEIGMVEGGNFYGMFECKPWFEPTREGILERMARMADSVAEDVELGFHFCYGDMGHKHFLEPKSTFTMVDLANGLFERSKRSINYIHMPVPKDRADREYYEPLQQLKLHGTELVLGLVHYDDLDGTKSRIASAGEFINSFSIATECGMGRTPPEQLENILSIFATVSTPTKP